MGRPHLDYVRTHISIPREMLERLDRIVGPKGRAAFIRTALGQMLDAAEEVEKLADQARRRRE